jgi:hypothetical protein
MFLIFNFLIFLVLRKISLGNFKKLFNFDYYYEQFNYFFMDIFNLLYRSINIENYLNY